QRMFALVIGDLDEDDHRHEDEGREQARGRGSAATPVEAQFLPVPCHESQFSRVNQLAKAKGSLQLAQSMQPVARPAAANMPKISPTWSSLCSAHSEQRNSVILAGVAGGRARFT